MRTTGIMALLLFALALGLMACGDESCTAGEQKCDGMKILTCEESGTWSEAEECPTGQRCMTMDSGVEHCMAM